MDTQNQTLVIMLGWWALYQLSYPSNLRQYFQGSIKSMVSIAFFFSTGNIASSLSYAGTHTQLIYAQSMSSDFLCPLTMVITDGYGHSQICGAVAQGFLYPGQVLYQWYPQWFYKVTKWNNAISDMSITFIFYDIPKKLRKISCTPNWRISQNFSTVNGSYH